MPYDNWRYRNSGEHRTLVCLPGWATDGRVFDRLNVEANIVVPDGPAPIGELAGLADLLHRQQCGPAIVLGWSLGGFQAVEFAKAYPELVEHLVLVGVRQHYPPESIAEIRQALQQDAHRCLTAFYRQCFLPSQRADYRDFSNRLEPAYLQEFTVTDLLIGLNYLATAVLSPDALPDCPMTIIHGAQDVIAPVEEARRLAEDARITLHVLPETAHAAFLSPVLPGLIARIM